MPLWEALETGEENTKETRDEGISLPSTVAIHSAFSGGRHISFLSNLISLFLFDDFMSGVKM